MARKKTFEVNLTEAQRNHLENLISSGTAKARVLTRARILLKADEVSVTFERLADGKIRVTTSSWQDAVVIWPSQVLEVGVIGKQVGLVRVDEPIAYLDIDDTSLLLRMCDA